MNQTAIESVQVIFNLLQLYLGIGLVFAIVFVIALVQRLDPSARSRSLGVRILAFTIVFALIALIWHFVPPNFKLPAFVPVGPRILVSVALFPLVGLVQRFVPGTHGLKLGFSFLIIPGVSVFWPLFLVRLLRGQKTTPTERNAHRLRVKPLPANSPQPHPER